MSNAESEAQARDAEARAQAERNAQAQPPSAESESAAPAEARNDTPPPESGPLGLDTSDPRVQSPAGLGAENPHVTEVEADLGQAQMQERMDRITEKGYIGGTPDPTPDANYSMLTPPDAPTPETDADLQAELTKNVAGNRLVNTGLTTAQTLEGAEPIPPAEGTKTPGESQTSQPQDLKAEVGGSQEGGSQ